MPISFGRGVLMAEIRKSFAAPSAGEARNFASEWLRDFDEHGPLDIKSIRVREHREVFIATIVYDLMQVEATPRHFPDYEPVLLKSA
jgi:hypothetical protein